jgi:GAF domain-containing protein
VEATVSGSVEAGERATGAGPGGELLEAGGFVVDAVLAGEQPESVAARIAAQACVLAGAPMAVLGRRGFPGRALAVEVKDRTTADPEVRRLEPGPLLRRLLEDGDGQAVATWPDDQELAGELGLEMALVTRLGRSDRPLGILVVGSRDPGWCPGTHQALSALAGWAGIALQCAQLNLEYRQLVAVDRERIASRVRLETVQTLFEARLDLQALAATSEDPKTAARLFQVVDTLDMAVRQLQAVMSAAVS